MGKRAGNCRVELVDRRSAVADDANQGVTWRLPEKGRFAGQGPVAENTESEEVGTVIDLQALSLFRRHGMEGSNERSRGRKRNLAFVKVLDQAEIQDLGVARHRDHDVAGFQVAVQDALAVRGREALGDLTQERYGTAPRQRTAGEKRPQRSPLDVLHDDTAPVLPAFNGIDLNDARMIETGNRPRLTPKAFLGDVASDGGRANELDGDETFQLFVIGPIDGAHATLPKLLLETIAPDAIRNHSDVPGARSRTASPRGRQGSGRSVASMARI